jgi:hypothetical protein
MLWTVKTQDKYGKIHTQETWIPETVGDVVKVLQARFYGETILEYHGVVKNKEKVTT